MWFGWGDNLTFFYNDAYRHDTLGLKHPWALGKKASEVWAEVWSDLSPRVDTVLQTGIATWDEALLLFLERSGFSEETYHTFSYSPLADDDGAISGVFCVVTEETARVIGERRLELLRHLGDRIASATTEPGVLEVVRSCLSQRPQDLPFCLIYLFDGRGETAHLACCTGTMAGSSIAPQLIERDSDNPAWPFALLLDQAKQIDVTDLEARFGEVPSGSWDLPPRNAVLAPIPQQGSDRPVGFLVAGINPYRPMDDAYSGFIDLLVGQVAGGIASARAYEAERMRAEELAKLDLAKTTFFSNVSHELRTPLTLMLGPLEDLLASPDAISPRIRQRVELAHRNSIRLLKLVNTLLDFSRLEAGRVQLSFEPVDLAEITAEMSSGFRSACEQAGLKLILNCSTLPEPVYVDRGMWEKVVLNLLSNALKFTYQGEIEVDVFTEDGEAVLVVRDTGTGIPAEALPRLFERFYRVQGARGRTHEGTGIGLALVQELVRLHGGNVTVSSKVGEGTQFQVRMPLGREHLPQDLISEPVNRDGPSEEHSLGPSVSEAFVGEAVQWLRETDLAEGDSAFAALESSPSNPQSPAARIIIADDNADLREYLHRLLCDQYAVTVVSNGAEALDAAKREKPDLILTDVMMPILDGFGLLEAVRQDEELREIPVLMLSARAGEEAKVDGLQLGADDYVVKPFSARELQARISSNLELARLRRIATVREEKLRRAAEASYLRMQEFAESLPQMVAERDATGKLCWANERFFQYTGLRLETASPERARTVMPPDDWDRFSLQWEATLQTGKTLQMEGQMRRHDGELRWWLLTTTPVLDLEGRVDRVYLSATDIHEQKEIEQELERRVGERTAELVEANREMEGFTYTVSHDLRSPLRSIIFNSAMLLEELGEGLSQSHKDLIARQVRSAKKLATLIDDLLKLSRVSRQELRVSEVDMTGLALRVADQLHLSEEKRAQIYIQPGMTAIADGQLLQFVFLNLLENACKFSPEGGPIRVGQEGDTFFVQDSGIGFDPVYANKVFQPFERLVSEEQFPGTGVGLANVKRIVERHRGTVWVESEMGKGAKFSFTLGSSSNDPS
jgi:PAS domain S-box-containing protein